jgi:hypothetical protein
MKPPTKLFTEFSARWFNTEHFAAHPFELLPHLFSPQSAAFSGLRAHSSPAHSLARLLSSDWMSAAISVTERLSNWDRHRLW